MGWWLGSASEGLCIIYLSIWPQAEEKEGVPRLGGFGYEDMWLATCRLTKLYSAISCMWDGVFGVLLAGVS